MEVVRLSENILDSALDSVACASFAKICGSNKANVLIFKITNLNLAQSIILKQESISSGGDFITQKDVIFGEAKYYCGVLIATISQLQHIINKCEIQPFGLKNLAAMLKTHINHKINLNPQIMGIINVTDDSFWEGSRVKNIDKILEKIFDMIENKVEIIDIGAASSRPGSDYVESSIELENLSEIFGEIKKQDLAKSAIFSIDTYNYDTAKRAVECGFSIINDVYELRDGRLVDLAKNNNNKIVIMHNGFLAREDDNLSDNILHFMDEFFSQKINWLLESGIKKEQIILDIGFGFGKNMRENIVLVQNLAHFKRFGCALLVGASRKRSIGEITGKDTPERLFGTLAAHQIALDNGADIIRVHDYREHIDMRAIWREFRK